jgi:hypothetical protein
MLVVGFDLDRPDASLVLLHRDFKSLCLAADFPDADLALHTTTHQPATVGCGGESSYSVVVGVVDDVH